MQRSSRAGFSRCLSAEFSRACLLLLSALLLFGCSSLQNPETSSQPAAGSSPYIGLRFVDAATGRGIPLVEARTTHGVLYVSDSAGWVAIHPEDIAAESLYLRIQSHGYTMAADGYGHRGVVIELRPGARQTVQLTRDNIAERLYRVTGEGIYRDSVLLGLTPPLAHGASPPGGVFGQDSVVNALYGDRLYWFWGDTLQGDGPLGNFQSSGATSPLPGSESLNPDEGIPLEYFVDDEGFTRAMCPLEEPGLVWLSCPMSFQEDGRDVLLVHYGRWRHLGEPLGSGIAAWSDEKSRFQKVREFPLDAPLRPRGHALLIPAGGQDWFRFGHVFPDVRVRARKNDILDPGSYQAYTCLSPGSRWNADKPALDRDGEGRLICGWKARTGTIEAENWKELVESGLASWEENRAQLRDSESGNIVVPHRGSVAWSDYRKRWILIATEVGGSSFLGEVWYAEADDPLGPWSNVRKIVSHDQYSFYNVKQHPYFASGPYIYFEGTYTRVFSNSQQPTPRYDYNQIMYRLDLDYLGKKLSTQAQ